jgi:hypothetical protein
MFDRLFRRKNRSSIDSTKGNGGRSSLADLTKSVEVLDKRAMNKVEGGYSANRTFQDLYDWTSTPGGNVPS